MSPVTSTISSTASARHGYPAEPKLRSDSATPSSATLIKVIGVVVGGN